MGYRARRTDSNQSEIVEALRSFKQVSVFITSSFGNGFGDLVVGINGFNYILEIKDGNKPLSAQKLTKDELEFHKAWKGQVCIIRSVDEAIHFVSNIIYNTDNEKENKEHVSESLS